MGQLVNDPRCLGTLHFYIEKRTVSTRGSRKVRVIFGDTRGTDFNLKTSPLLFDPERTAQPEVCSDCISPLKHESKSHYIIVVSDNVSLLPFPPCRACPRSNPRRQHRDQTLFDKPTPILDSTTLSPGRSVLGRLFSEELASDLLPNSRYPERRYRRKYMKNVSAALIISSSLYIFNGVCRRLKRHSHFAIAIIRACTTH